jgi:hypothetical protein
VTPTQALIAALGVEHQVVYGYGAAGAHLPAAGRAEALRELDAHRLRRDQLAALVTQMGATASAAAPAYALPFPVTDATTATALCARLEDACAGAAWDLVAATSAGSAARRLGVSWLGQSAVAAANWRGGSPVPALPGQPH